jgi:DNA-binding XRE family transcriptional regulator
VIIVSVRKGGAMAAIMTPLERKAAFKAATTLAQTTQAVAARRLGVSYNHLMLVLADQRQGSLQLKGKVAAFLKRPVAEVFGEAVAR